ncbi:unnamed protein product [Prorocentrum cordatum]|uniref:Uncharacterized protein n=1 Tax=Prorocentrum cordatum TaxID=2364126 RepID=A0ABN9QKB8_9DINO|nr:unnamed protein product [Polarella glacialis]
MDPRRPSLPELDDALLQAIPAKIWHGHIWHACLGHTFWHCCLSRQSSVKVNFRSSVRIVWKRSQRGPTNSRGCSTVCVDAAFCSFSGELIYLHSVAACLVLRAALCCITRVGPILLHSVRRHP